MRFLLRASVVFVVLLLQQTVFAKDLTSRLGVGYANEFSTNLPSLAAKYYPSQDMAIGADLGINTGPDTSQFGFLAKVERTIFPEDNMNFYMGAGAGLLSNKVPGGTNNSGFELQGFVGGEFFFSGIDSLGFSFEAGIGIVSISSGVTFRTIGADPFRASVIFYF